MRKKLSVLLLMLLVASLTLSGCSLVVKDAVKDAARIILDVGGEQFNKADFSAAVTEQENYLKNYYSYYTQMYQMYGMSYGMPADSQIHDEAVQAVYDQKVRDIVLAQKGKELGLDTLTEEETAAAMAQAETDYQDVLTQIREGGYVDSSLEGDALEEAVLKFAADNNIKLESYQESALKAARENKVRDYAIKDVTVTDQEVQDDYKVHVDEAKTQYETDLSAYGTAVNGGSKAYYTPAGYRYVKQILVGFNADDKTAMDQASGQVTSTMSALNDAQNALKANQDALAAEDLTEEKKAELTGATAALEQAVTDAQTAYDEAKAANQQAMDTAFANIQPTVDEIMQKVAAGEDFDALIEKYNTDPGMQSEPGKTNGYAVCAGYTQFMSEFVDAAMALENVGDVSEPVKNTTYGYHIIKYMADIPEGETGLDAFAEEIRTSLLSSKQDEKYQKKLDEWIAATKITYHKDWLDD